MSSWAWRIISTITERADEYQLGIARVSAALYLEGDGEDGGWVRLFTIMGFQFNNFWILKATTAAINAIDNSTVF